MTDKDLIVYYCGKPKVKINSRLLDKQKCWDNLEEIKELHVQKFCINDLILNTDNKIELKELCKNITECEFKLQELWGFPKDKNFHRFWETPKCTCPKMDNEDAYPTGYYAINMQCILHGE